MIKEKGYTLIDLIVAIAILMVIVMVVVINLPTFTSKETVVENVVEYHIETIKEAEEKIKSLQEKNIEIPFVEKTKMLFEDDVVITGRGAERLEESYELKLLDVETLDIETFNGKYLYDLENNRVIVSTEYIFHFLSYSPETLNEIFIEEYIKE